jgi:hypothetical protein
MAQELSMTYARKTLVSLADTPYRKLPLNVDSWS